MHMYMQLIAPCTINMHAGMAGGNGDHIHMDMRHARLRYGVLYLPLIKRMLEPPFINLLPILPVCLYNPIPQTLPHLDQDTDG